MSTSYDTTYNGWTNRETWLVNLHFGDMWNEDNPPDSPDAIRDLVYDVCEECVSNTFVMDMMGLCYVDWHELYEHYVEE